MFRTLKLKQKMLLLPALTMLSYVVLLAVSLAVNAKTSGLLHDIQQGYAPAVELSRDLSTRLGQIPRALQDAVAAEDAEQLQAADRIRDAFFARLEDGRKLSTLEPGRIDALHAAFDAYYRLARGTSLSLIQKTGGDPTHALGEMNEKFQALKQSLDAASERDRKAMDSAVASATASQRTSTAASLIVIATFLVILGVLSLRIVSGVAEPLLALTRAATRIAQEGDLNHHLEVRSGDETGELALSFRAMVDRLRSIPVALSGSVEDLSTAVRSLSDLTGGQNANLQRQAAGLAEASVTTQEIKQTSSVAASKAEMVLQVAVKAEELSASGQKAVEASIEGLEAIRSQVDGMVEQITELSRRMQTVGEITERVKDLADQSNMLALNAAIEATRAGDYGKGFSVVAREIRSLADQSLQSTVRIREILSEVQEALRTTVDSTQKGTRRIESGLQQVRRSGDSLRAITEVIEQSSQAARQIVASVSQQNAGIAQISSAIVGLNDAMQDSLSDVRKTEESAANVQSTSTRLAELVSGFKM